MHAQDAIAILRRHESALRARGVAHAAVFGSVARGDNHLESDLDILVEFEPGLRARSMSISASRNTSRACLKGRLT